MANMASEYVDVGDIFYTYYERDFYSRSRCRTWSFRAQGVLKTKTANYILGPGDVLYAYGIDCFKTAQEAREMGMRKKRNKTKADQYRFVRITDEEKVRI